MKKLFLFIYLVGIAAYVGYSQMSLSLSDSTGPLANNATIYKSSLPSSGESVAYVFVKNNSASDMSIMAKKVIIDTVTGSLNTFCWGLCFSPTVYVSPNPLTIKAGRTDSLDFSGHYDARGQKGTSVIRYVFYDRSNPLDSVCVNVTFKAYPLGIESQVPGAEMSNACPNPASGSTTITCSSAVSGSLVIRNLLGSTVKEIPVNAGSDKIQVNTADLPEGVYFYSLSVDGKSNVTKKLVIRH